MIRITEALNGTKHERIYFTGIDSDFQPSEIIAIRPDGTSESTNPEALKMREQAIKSTIECYEQNRKFIAADVATLRLELDAAQMRVISEYLRGRAELEPEVERLESELKEKNAYLERIRIASAIPGREPYDHSPFNCVTLLAGHANNLQIELKSANDELQKRPKPATRSQLEQELSGLWDIRRSEQCVISRLRAEVLEAQEARDRFKRERDQLKRQLEGAVTQTIVKEEGYNAATCERFITFTNGSTIKFHDKIAGRLSKCREGKRAIAANYNSLVGTFDQIKRALGNCNSSDIVPIITGLQSTIAKLHIAESGRFTDERNALASELSQAKAELQRLKTTYSMDRVHGMTLEEVRGMKYQLAANREQIDAANARVASVSADLYNTEDMNKKLLARLELIRSHLGCQFGAIEMKVYELQQVQCKLDAVTRALAG